MSNSLIEKFQAFLDKITEADYEITVGDQKQLGELGRETQKVINNDETTLKTFRKLISIQQAANNRIQKEGEV